MGIFVSELLASGKYKLKEQSSQSGHRPYWNFFFFFFGIIEIKCTQYRKFGKIFGKVEKKTEVLGNKDNY